MSYVFLRLHDRSDQNLTDNQDTWNYIFLFFLINICQNKNE